ncbi:hypothetical protein [Sporisorium scitamineum]|uniref:Uncharacterized protein n=1 Tax=Sporisorium scitamineum TaxID=49012 RepID=A0A0F7S4D7_9BASI|nr:hypothetical protein [Sporisorium scitamineum]
MQYKAVMEQFAQDHPHTMIQLPMDKPYLLTPGMLPAGSNKCHHCGQLSRTIVTSMDMPQPCPTPQALHQAVPMAAMPVSMPLAIETGPVSMPAISLTMPVSSPTAMQQVLQHTQAMHASAMHMPLHSLYSAVLKLPHDIQAMQADLSNPLKGGDDQLQSGEMASTSVVNLIDLTTKYPLAWLIADIQCGPQ